MNVLWGEGVTKLTLRLGRSNGYAVVSWKSICRSGGWQNPKRGLRRECQRIVDNKLLPAVEPQTQVVCVSDRERFGLFDVKVCIVELVFFEKLVGQ